MSGALIHSATYLLRDIRLGIGSAPVARMGRTSESIKVTTGRSERGSKVAWFNFRRRLAVSKVSAQFVAGAASLLLSAFLVASAGCSGSSEGPEREANVAKKSLAVATTEYHVAKTGSDSNVGSSSAPFLTVKRAATAAQPGDTVTVHAGTYREWVDPPRGGSSESARITYRAAPGEAVYLKGSEQISTWVASGSVWVATIPSSFFGSFNPYSLTVANAFLSNPGSQHRGQVYLNGVPYTEVSSASSVVSPGQWASAINGNNTVITAHFGAVNPNSALAEINVRRLVFAPTKNFLGYITVNGFHILQAATNWSTAEGGEEPQEGAIAPNAGFKWRIERNWISDSRCSCLALGRGGTWGLPGTADANETNSGSHLVRYNTIERCGEAGINGSRGAIFSTIEYNLVQDINVGSVFDGDEGAVLKFHTAIDMIIRGNVLRRTSAPSVAGIWLDWQSQGSRITGNVIYAIGSNNVIVLEADHGPTLVDNNVLVGGTIKELAESVCVTHNLLKGIGFYVSGDGRTPAYHLPHQYIEAGTAAISPQQNTYYSNLLMGSGSVPSTSAVGNVADYNYAYDSIALSGPHSKTSTVSSGLSTTDNADGVTVSFKADNGPASLACPMITKAFVGNSTLVGMGLENPDGSAIVIDKDAFGNSRGNNPTAGPFQSLATGVNSFRFYAGADAGTSLPNVAPAVAMPAIASPLTKLLVLALLGGCGWYLSSKKSSQPARPVLNRRAASAVRPEPGSSRAARQTATKTIR